MNLKFPYQLDKRGRTAEAEDDRHIEEMIEQVLFTSPGERVNRPTFGSGLLGLVFAPNGTALAATAQVSVQAALQEWLGDVIQVEGVDVQSDAESLLVTVRYTVRQTRQQRSAEFRRTTA